MDWHEDSKTEVGGHVKREGRRQHREMEMTYVNADYLVSHYQYRKGKKRYNQRFDPTTTAEMATFVAGGFVDLSVISTAFDQLQTFKYSGICPLNMI